MATTADPLAARTGRTMPVRALLRTLVRGRAADPAWERPAAIGLIAMAAVLYTWQLDVSGYANAYYSAAAQAGSQSWSAFFFGSLDASNFITVDKPPAALWLMGLSVRLFGLSSWSVLLPQALMGVLAVFATYRVARSSFGPGAGLIAGLVMALTPISVVIFRYNNPDALLTLLLVVAAGALLRGIHRDSTRWMALAGALVGLGFLTKYLQALMVVPVFALVLLVAAPGSWRRRTWQLLVAAAATLLAGGWWVAIVELIPAGSRPYVGGSTTNSVLDLVFGYNGLGRIFGQGGGLRFGAGFGAPGFGGTTGIFRLFNAEWGGQISWLIPLALAGLAVLAWTRRGGRRTDPVLAGTLLWGGWLAVHVVVFSFAEGIIHPYYSVILAPAIGALTGAGTVAWWRGRARSPGVSVVFAAGVVATGWWATMLLARSPEFVPALGPVVAAATGIAAALVLVATALPDGRRVGIAAIAAILVAVLAGPTAYAVESAGSAYGGGDPSAGPTVAIGGSGFLPGGPNAFGGFGGLPGAIFGRAPRIPGAADASVVDYLVAHRGSTDWLVAAEGSQAAAQIQLETGQPVMAMGGFNGSDPWPTASELASLVASGRLRYVLLDAQGGRGAGARAPGIGVLPGAIPGGGTYAADFVGWGAWVQDTCSPVTIGGVTGPVYDCAPAG
jgi:4-amino-4-deoxy-L-arabinose transferase-like glycosyltransferase